MSSNIIENIVKKFSKLPGIGPRASRRIILKLAQNKEKILSDIIEGLQLLRNNINNCKLCGNIDEGEVCNICQDPKRDSSLICVVENVSDLWAIERVQNFKGKYHILGGNLSAMSGKTIEDLNINGLVDKIKKDNNIKEIIIATSATIDGQTTAHYLQDVLNQYNLKISRLSFGIPVGSELDYLDDGTIAVAFKARK
jgi:recombination protein RecR